MSRPTTGIERAEPQERLLRAIAPSR
jgi:hypothetical protein